MKNNFPFPVLVLIPDPSLFVFPSQDKEKRGYVLQKVLKNQNEILRRFLERLPFTEVGDKNHW